MGKRAQLMKAVDSAMERAQKTQKDAAQGQAGLFGLFNEQPSHGKSGDDLPNVPDWEEGERLANEKEVLGFFVSGHPLDKYADKIKNLSGVISTAEALERKPPERRWSKPTLLELAESAPHSPDGLLRSVTMGPVPDQYRAMGKSDVTAIGTGSVIHQMAISAATPAMALRAGRSASSRQPSCGAALSASATSGPATRPVHCAWWVTSVTKIPTPTVCIHEPMLETSAALQISA